MDTHTHTHKDIYTHSQRGCWQNGDGEKRQQTGARPEKRHEQREIWHSSNGNNHSSHKCSCLQIPTNIQPLGGNVTTHTHTHTLNHYIRQQTFKHFCIIEVVSLNHILSSFKSLCAGIREVNLPVCALCCHLSVVGLLFSLHSPTKDS